jgi:hypothetical protein
MVLPLEPTEMPGVYRRGSRFVAVYRVAGRQHKESAATLAEARAIKLARQADARERRRGPTLQASVSRGSTATRARVTTSCARRPAASTAACWSPSR